MLKHISALLAASSVASSAVIRDTKFQNLTELLSSIPELSEFSGAVTRDPTVLSDFALATNVTVFATTNAAFAPVVGPQSGFLSVPDSVHAGLQYSITNGILHSANFTTSGTFMQSHLTNLSWSAVTGGQVLEVVQTEYAGSAENSHVGVSSGAEMLVYAANKVSVKITTPDIPFYDSNGNLQGLVHIVDGHLYPPQNLTSTADSLQIASVGSAVEGNQVDPNAVIPDITVFAYNNESYNNYTSHLPSFSPSQLDMLRLYNSANGSVAYSNSFTTAGNNITSREGDVLTLKLGSDGTLFVNDAVVLIKDVLIKNGVMHVIDRALYPPGARLHIANHA